MDFKIDLSIPGDTVIMACHITGVYDVNRNMTLEDDHYALVRNWAESLARASVHGIIFHNNFTKETCETFENEYISFVDIAYNSSFSPNVYRYFVYRDFLRQHLHSLTSVFVTDITDVSLINNPFIDPYFIKSPNVIFCGDEPKKLNDEWMNQHSAHLRKNIPDFAAYERVFKDEMLLNCGIIGGAAPLLLDFIEQLCFIHDQANRENTTLFTGDMGAFNYLARTKFNNQLHHGAPVNTEFKGYENERLDCWFRHK
jgi:hypothetical protein